MRHVVERGKGENKAISRAGRETAADGMKATHEESNSMSGYYNDQGGK